MNKMRVHIIVITLVIVTLLGVGGQKLLYMQNVQRPLNQRFLAIAGVESYELLDTPGAQDLVVTVKPTADLQDMYQELEDVARQVLGEEIGRIRLVDRPNQRLEEVLHAAHFPVQEGIATGGFTAMNESISEIMADANIPEYRLAVDAENVYLQMLDGDYFIYSVYPRRTAADRA